MLFGGVRHRQHSLEVGFIRLTGRCDGPAASSVPATEPMGPRTGPGPTGAVFMLLPVLILSLQSPLEANFPERLELPTCVASSLGGPRVVFAHIYVLDRPPAFPFVRQRQDV